MFERTGRRAVGVICGPLLKRLRDKLTIPLSVDTYKAAIAEKALELGADIINDPSALTFDPDLARTVAQANAGWRPTVNAQGSYGMERFGFTPFHPDPTNPARTVANASEHPVQGQMTVTQPLFRGGRTYAEVRRAKALVRADEAAVENVRVQLSYTEIRAPISGRIGRALGS